MATPSRTQLILATVVALLSGPSLSGAQTVTSEIIPPKEFFDRAATISELAKKRVVTAEELHNWLSTDSVLLIDLRGRPEFAHLHIKGAVNLPVTDLTDEALERVVGDRSRRIVIYCTDNLFPTRRVALTTLGFPTIYQLGYENLYQLEELWNRPGATLKLADSGPTIGGLEMESSPPSPAP